MKSRKFIGYSHWRLLVALTSFSHAYLSNSSASYPFFFIIAIQIFLHRCNLASKLTHKSRFIIWFLRRPWRSRRKWRYLQEVKIQNLKRQERRQSIKNSHRERQIKRKQL